MAAGFSNLSAYLGQQQSSEKSYAALQSAQRSLAQQNIYAQGLSPYTTITGGDYASASAITAGAWDTSVADLIAKPPKRTEVEMLRGRVDGIRVKLIS